MLGEAMRERGLELGRMSRSSFRPTRSITVSLFADSLRTGQSETYVQAVAKTGELASSSLGRDQAGRQVRLLGEFVDEADPETISWTWCGRFAHSRTPCRLESLAAAPRLMGWPLAYETSMSAPPLDVSMRRSGSPRRLHETSWATRGDVHLGFTR
jgi:hypothetical protein